VIGNIVVSALNSLQKVEKSVFVNVQSWDQPLLIKDIQNSSE
jgi:hypothetical protein